VKAIILAAGYGTRLYPLTENMPKPLVTVAGKPILNYTLEKVKALDNVDEVFIITNAKFHPHMMSWKNTFPFPKPITIVNDGTKSNEDRLGSLGDIHFTLNSGNIADDILVIAGDNLFDFSLQPLVDLFHKHKSSVVYLYDVKDYTLAKLYGVVGINKDHKMIAFSEKPSRPASTLISTGVYIYPQKVIPLLRDFAVMNNNTDNVGNFLEVLHRRQDVYCIVSDNLWFDIGSIEVLKAAEELYSQ